MTCQKCDSSKEPALVLCKTCAELDYDRAYHEGHNDGANFSGIRQKGQREGLHEGIRRCAVEVNGIMCVNGVPLVELLAAVNEG